MFQIEVFAIEMKESNIDLVTELTDNWCGDCGEGSLSNMGKNMFCDRTLYCLCFLRGSI